jgi:ATP-dependent DNA helicase RecG
MVLALDTNSITALKGVGKKTVENLAKLHIYKLSDLLFHLPFRYEDRTKITPIADAQQGDRILIEGRVEQVFVVGKRKLQMVCRLADDSGAITLRFFHFNADQLRRLKQSELSLRCFGEVREGLHHQLEMAHPEYQSFDQITERLSLSDRLTPIYPTTQGVGQAVLRRLIKEALYWLDTNGLKELLPEALRQQHRLVDIQIALKTVHAPPAGIDQKLLQEGRHPLQKRLAFEELLAHQLSLYFLRQQKRAVKAYPITIETKLQQQFLQRLAFKLTRAQQRVIDEIMVDLQQQHPMLRLVQGDVGSGKTVVAAVAALNIMSSGRQSALMAPTEILAEQHWQNFNDWFVPLGIKVGLLLGSQTAKEKQAQLDALVNGETQFIVGTHALFQKDVIFQQLALVIIDEQHRFGVHQRMALHDKGIQGGCCPHQLIMTATPIPRTLAMTAYADLDCSVIDELPPGRKPIETVLISEKRRAQIIKRVRANCLEGRQAYWVCTLIEESEALQCQAAANTAEELQSVLPELRIGLVHGRLKSIEKDAVMQHFKAGKIDLLVATTVIEVGVDVSNASLMIIENPERLGLAQLHQLRGRVGRGSLASYCVLLYHYPLSQNGEQRLKIMRDSCDGFYIAEEDLKLRGPGELLGSRQSGLMRFKVADLLRDQDLIDVVRDVGQSLLKTRPEIAEQIVERWLTHQLAYIRN